jgi:hypothetical protein
VGVYELNKKIPKTDPFLEKTRQEIWNVKEKSYGWS